MCASVRVSARGVLLDTNDHVALLEYEDASPIDPLHPEILRYWVTPGGGREGRETLQATLRREIREEIGITDVTVGRRLAIRRLNLVLVDQGLTRVEEHYFVARTTTTEMDFRGQTANERAVFKTARWWSLESLEQCEPAVLRPPQLVSMVRRALGVAPSEVQVYYE